MWRWPWPVLYTAALNAARVGVREGEPATSGCCTTLTGGGGGRGGGGGAHHSVSDSVCVCWGGGGGSWSCTKSFCQNGSLFSLAALSFDW